MSRFFVRPEDISGGKIYITDRGDIHHMKKVLRLAYGDEVDISDGAVWEYRARIEEIGENQAVLTIVDKQKFAREPHIRITLFQGIPKAGKMEGIIQKSVELGASKIVPVLTRRCISRPKDFAKKLERLNKIALEAAKQSGRGIIPEVMPIIDFKTAVSQMSETDCPVMLYEEGGVRFSELETEGKKSFSLLIGSEGGFDPEEAEYAKNAGINTVWLGERILRCETAPLTAISILMFITKNL